MHIWNVPLCVGFGLIYIYIFQLEIVDAWHRKMTTRSVWEVHNGKWLFDSFIHYKYRVYVECVVCCIGFGSVSVCVCVKTISVKMKWHLCACYSVHGEWFPLNLVIVCTFSHFYCLLFFPFFLYEYCVFSCCFALFHSLLNRTEMQKLFYTLKQLKLNQMRLI